MTTKKVELAWNYWQCSDGSLSTLIQVLLNDGAGSEAYKAYFLEHQRLLRGMDGADALRTFRAQLETTPCGRAHLQRIQDVYR